ncbi:MAG: hypothetical protein NTZ74_10450 [Chloroflexi bacterium]|nr:hypothetical protein [Chloroflexota bacterium]
MKKPDYFVGIDVASATFTSTIGNMGEKWQILVKPLRYGWLVRPCPPRTFTLEEVPSFSWRTGCIVRHSASFTTATFGMDGWLGLIHHGLSPWKKCQAFLGAPTR